ncbi:MAG: response regulator [Candidatus Solibacter sp.]
MVEDSPTDAYVIGEALSACPFSYELMVLTDGDAALTLLQRVEDEEGPPVPGLVLLDLNLPKVSGIAVLAALRASRRCADAPVVVVTSSDSASDMKAIFDLGVTAYFRKPHNLEAFMTLSKVIVEALHKQNPD